ncbi:hypothetical protein SISNIDRAFT_393047, partial [Sistotremastrum niveocremeum HHB9708]
GLVIDKVKREFLHLTRRTRDKSISPSITLRSSDGTVAELQPQTTVKWLGVLFDRKLTFLEHVKSLADRAKTCLNAMKMLGNTVRGL